MLHAVCCRRHPKIAAFACTDPTIAACECTWNALNRALGWKSLCDCRSCCGIAAYAFDHRGPLVHFRKLCLNLHAAIFAITVLTDLRVVASAGKPRLVSAPCNHVACIHRQVLTASPVARVRWPGADGMPDSSLSPPLAPVYSFTRFQLVPAQHRQHG